MMAHNVIAIVAVYNEADIVGQVFDHLHEQEIRFVVLDNGSNDGSIEIAQSFEGRGLLEHKIAGGDVWRLRENLDCLIEMAARYSPDWILVNDADEFLEPRESGRTLNQTIAAEDQNGFNVIQCDNFRFVMTERDCDSQEPDVRKKLRFYSWHDDYKYRAWKYYTGATCESSAGHYPIFPRGIRAMVSPRNLVLRHYPFRSPQQAVRKVFVERLPRYAPEERAKGWHFHYDHYGHDQRLFVLDSTRLSERDGSGKWDLTKRFDAGPNFKSPTQQELFGQSPFLRTWLQCWRLLYNAYATRLFSLTGHSQIPVTYRRRP